MEGVRGSIPLAPTIRFTLDHRGRDIGENNAMAPKAAVQ
jgi:hypothetical protein